jgi:hypothetical protein
MSIRVAPEPAGLRIAERATERWYVATRTVTYVSSSGRSTIDRGDRVRPGHEAIARHPGAFALEGTENARKAADNARTSPPKTPLPAGTAQRPSTPSTKRTPALWPLKGTANGRLPSGDDELERPSWALPSRPLKATATAELRTNRSPITVQLSPRALESIEAEIDATPRGFETGGRLPAGGGMSQQPSG